MTSEWSPKIDSAWLATVRAAEHKIVLVATKTWATNLIARDGALPAGFGVIERYGAATEAFTTVLDALLGPVKANILYVGDLDPFDLACFRALQVGHPLLRSGRRPRYRTLYAGVSDEWLDPCERAARRPFQIESVCIPLTDAERHEWAALRATWPGVARVIGPRSARLLESGFKLELEGASNPAIYRPRHAAWVRRHILGIAASRP